MYISDSIEIVCKRHGPPLYSKNSERECPGITCSSRWIKSVIEKVRARGGGKGSGREKGRDVDQVSSR